MRIVILLLAFCACVALAQRHGGRGPGGKGPGGKGPVGHVPGEQDDGQDVEEGGGRGRLRGHHKHGHGRKHSRKHQVHRLKNVKDFGEFLSQSGIEYGNLTERALREGIFSSKKNVVERSNAKGRRFKLALNAFADLSREEFVKKLTGHKKSKKGEAKAKKHRKKASHKKMGDRIPDSFDWREKGGVTPVKFQGWECGACWAFAVTGAIEGHVFRKTGELIPLSEQHLVDCGEEEFGLLGCEGGYQEYGFEYVIENMGISRAEPYPYVEDTEMCKYEKEFKGAEISGFATIDPLDEETMKTVVATLGPVACSVNAAPESFQLYDSGVYADDECNQDEVNHSILVVGYGSEGGDDYWIVKNSWTDKWGEDGYMRLLRGKNACGIATECSYPLLE